MATEQVQLMKQTHSAGWQKIFNQDVTTVKGSLLFVKQFTALSFSIISYMRSIFPEIAYTEKEFDEIKVKILAGNYECRDAYLMTTWIKSAFDALDNTYMRQLVLEVLTLEDSLLEYYAIEYKYTEEGPTCSLSTNKKTRLDFDKLEFENSTKKLINNLLTITENLEPLPAKYKLQLRINYYDAATPPHYKPKFFSHAKPNDLQLEKLKKQSMGSLETPYHSISVYSGSALVALDDSEQGFYFGPEQENERPSAKGNDEEIPMKDNFGKVKRVTDLTKMDAETSENFKENQLNVVDKLKNNSNWTWTMDKSASQDDNTILVPDKSQTPEVKLCCLCSQEYEQDNTFKCEHCESRHHFVCYKISTYGKMPENKCCYFCAKLDTNIECTDVTLMKYKPRQAKHLAIYRQVLYRCHGMKSVSPKTLEEMSVPSDLIPQIITKLVEENFIRCQNRSKSIYRINKAKLAHFFKFYFST